VVRLLGRTSVDVIKSGGYKLSALEIEAVLAAHPDVAEVAVVGLPHPDLGEEVAAAVVLRPGAEVDRDNLAKFAAERLAYFEVPTAWWFVDDLPKTVTGKIVKAEVRRRWPAA
jgi:acyl-coenzyme A synthetase/AMP-(fatty) acid ligase